MNNHTSDESSYAWNAPKVICQIIDGEAILIHFERGHYFSVLGSGAWAIEMLSLGLNLGDIAAAFARHFGIDFVRAHEDLEEFLNQLLIEDLVVVRPGNEAAGAASQSGPDGCAYAKPVLAKYTDLEDLLLLDPVHDVIAMTDEQKYGELERAFECTRESSEICTYDVELGGRNVRFHFAGRELLALLTPAMAHLRTNPGRVDLSLFIADTESTGVSPRLNPDSFGDDLVQNAQSSPRAIRCTYVPTSELYCCLHPERASGYIWLRSRSALQHWDISAPFRPLLGWWAESVGAQLTHGAVVGTQQAAILLGGESGVGKSTLTLACLKHGLFTLGDDYVWIEPGPPVRAFSIYGTAKVAQSELHRHFGEFATCARHAEQEKACLYLSDTSKDLLTSSLPLRALAAVRVSGEPVPRIKLASAIEVLSAIAPSSLRQLSGSTLGGLQRFGQFMAHTRLLVFEASTNYDANAQAIADLLAELSHDTNGVPRTASSSETECVRQCLLGPSPGIA